MEFDIHAGKRVLYKVNGHWNVGQLEAGAAVLDKNGLYLPIVNRQDYVNINDIFFDAVPVNDYIKDYKEYFMTREEYIQFIESEDFVKNIENAYVSDGEYMYYPVSKYNKNWIEKQPFKYIVRNN